MNSEIPEIILARERRFRYGTIARFAGQKHVGYLSSERLGHAGGGMTRSNTLRKLPASAGGQGKRDARGHHRPTVGTLVAMPFTYFASSYSCSSV